MMQKKTSSIGILAVLMCYSSSTSVLVDAFVAPTSITRRSATLLRSAVVNDDNTNKSEADSQNIFGIFSDALTGAAFNFLHAFDKNDCDIEDSSKNLRVLWVRALLNTRGWIKDDVAQYLLPKSTRSLVTSPESSKIFNSILKFTEWIQARTEFIDTSLDRFLSSPVCNMNDKGEKQQQQPLPCNIVLFGAGYDTRALRYRHSGKAKFYEVDLPSVVHGKEALYTKFQKEQDPTWDLKGRGPTLIPLDFNDCGNERKTSLVETLREAGLQKNVPTLFVWEAVLFYVNQDAVENIMNELFAFAQPGGNGDSERAETLLCFTDSLKPFVDVPFTNEAQQFFDKQNLDLLEHRSRWGGAVHFALAATRGTTTATTDTVTTTTTMEQEDKLEQPSTIQEATTTKKKKEKKQDAIRGKIGRHVSNQVGGLVNSYMPTQANNLALLENPSFDNCWYAIGYSWQMDGYENAVEAAMNQNKKKKKHNTASSKPFATRLWGEPLVIYRDKDGELVAMADVCPHRSAPLSMGTVEDGELVCFYHGWRFGENGKCTDIPTLRAVENEEEEEKKKKASGGSGGKRYMDQVNKARCGNMRAVAEHDGLVYIWRGHILEADPSLIPNKRKGDMETIAMDSVLDYSVDYSYIVENNLDSPHLFYLHDGSVPPIEEIGLMNSNLPKLRLRAFTDDCGFGHLGRLGKDGRPKKVIRFDPPNIVRHGGVSGFEEEFHCIPIAPHRTRVLIRQHIPKGPILSTITGIPGLKPALTALVNSWNYHIGLEDAVVMQGQAHRIEDLGAPRMGVGGLGDDLIKKYWKWREAAHSSLEPDATSGIQTPYLGGLEGNGLGQMPSGIPTGTVYSDEPNAVQQIRASSRQRNIPLVNDDGMVDTATGQMVGSWGIKQNYIQDLPAANFPPMNYKRYSKYLVLDDVVKSLFAGKEPSSTMVKTEMADMNTKGEEVFEGKRTNSGLAETPSNYVRGLVAAGFVVAATDAVIGGGFGRSVAAAFSEITSGEALSLEQRLMLVNMFNDMMKGI